MSYSSSVLKQSMERLEEERVQRAKWKAQKRAEIFKELPEVEQIDKELQKTMPKVLAIAFRKGEDPQKAIAKVRMENLATQQRRRDLLSQHGYTEFDLDDTPRCKHCDDSGWIGATMCQCLQRICAEEQTKELSLLLNIKEQAFQKFQLDYYSDTIWQAYGRSPKLNMQKVLKLCQYYANEFPHFAANNLLFHGEPGLGKTFLSACIAKVVAEKGYSVVYDTAGQIFSSFEEGKFSRETQELQEAKSLMQKYLRCDLLILDDLGSEMTTPFVKATLYQLINTRLIEGRHTIISSNFDVEYLQTRYGKQIASRLIGEYEDILFFGEDIRKLKKK